MDYSVRKLVVVCSACAMDPFKLYGNYDEDDFLNKRMMRRPFLSTISCCDDSVWLEGYHRWCMHMNKMNEIINSYVQDSSNTVEGAIQWLSLVNKGR